jgi:uncharacterized protein YecE (DUF72 family)
VARGTVRIGCSGWSYDAWRGDLYPQQLPKTRWLAAYAERFDTVEVNTTFYRLPARAAVEQWVRATPPGFCFTVKASRYLTHIKRLQTVPDGVARLCERLEPMAQAGRLAAMLWQLPANFHRDVERLRVALDALPAGRHAFEFRHASWFTDDVDALLREHDVALVRADDARRPLPARPSPASWSFVRLHYGHRGRGGNYGPKELDAWAAAIDARARGGDDVFVYCNNDWCGFAPRNALGLMRRLGIEPYGGLNEPRGAGSPRRASSSRARSPA